MARGNHTNHTNMKFKSFLESEQQRVSVYVYNKTGRNAIVGALKALKWTKRFTYYSKTQQARDGVQNKFDLAGQYSGTLTREEVDDLEHVLAAIAKEWQFNNMLEMGVEIYVN